MPEAKRDYGDEEMHELFEQFEGQLVSPGGAASLLGVSRKTIYTLGKRERLRVFHSSDKDKLSESGAKWTLIPIADLAAYAKQVGRPFPKGPWDKT